MSLSPRAAADQVGLTPRSIVKAIRAGRLQAERTEAGEWRIESEDLHRLWSIADARLAESRTYVATPQDEVVSLLRAQIADLRTERDHWRELAHKLAMPQGRAPSTNAPAMMAAVFGAVAQFLFRRRR